MEVDKDAAIEELLESMDEEYFKGANAMLSHIRKEVSGCYGKNDGCSICQEGRKFLVKMAKQKVKEIKEENPELEVEDEKEK